MAHLFPLRLWQQHQTDDRRIDRQAPTNDVVSLIKKVWESNKQQRSRSEEETMDEVVSSSRRRVIDLFLPRNRLDKQMTGSLLPSFFPFSLSHRIRKGKHRLGERGRGGATMRFITGEQMAAAMWPNECVERQSRGIFLNPTCLACGAPL